MDLILVMEVSEVDLFPGPIERALNEALDDAEADLLDRDQAAVALARRYATELDAAEGDQVPKLASGLLSVLEQLRMTPKARQAVVKGGGSDDAGNSRRAALVALRGEHDTRVRPDDT